MSQHFERSSSREYVGNPALITIASVAACFLALTALYPCGVSSHHFVYIQSLAECPCPNCRFRRTVRLMVSSYQRTRSASSPGDLNEDSRSSETEVGSEGCGCADGWGGGCECRNGGFGGSDRRGAGRRGGTERRGVGRGGTRRGGGRAGRRSSNQTRQNPGNSDRHNDGNGGQTSGSHAAHTVQGPSRQNNGTQNRWSTRGLFNL
ncbi:hypothetical protein BCON_0250g00120 [Botryotinia convoluta]|uniref:Uncharacterized protein n=1 Tax=Botryotinia convoluta TaxID=54673 RepID=A0A4Z1HGN7_9HELO|nr:hypothetical protein BCON_0250g00120 [Botryotinia convoluta]